VARMGEVVTVETAELKVVEAGDKEADTLGDFVTNSESAELVEVMVCVDDGSSEECSRHLLK